MKKKLATIEDLMNYLKSIEEPEKEIELEIPKIILSDIYDFDGEIYDENGDLLEGLENLEDEKIIALAKHLEIDALNANDNIENDGNNTYIISGNEYKIYTNDEANDADRNYCEMIVDDDMFDIRKKYPHIVDYVDTEKMVEDYMGDRGNHLASYDGIENEETVSGTKYYIYIEQIKIIMEEKICYNCKYFTNYQVLYEDLGEDSETGECFVNRNSFGFGESTSGTNTCEQFKNKESV